MELLPGGCCGHGLRFCLSCVLCFANTLSGVEGENSIQLIRGLSSVRLPAEPAYSPTGWAIKERSSLPPLFLAKSLSAISGAGMEKEPTPQLSSSTEDYRGSCPLPPSVLVFECAGSDGVRLGGMDINHGERCKPGPALEDGCGVSTVMSP